MPRKPSFFERLTGSVQLDEDFSYENETPRHLEPQHEKGRLSAEEEHWMEEEANDGQLSVDVYQTPNDIVIKTMVAGVKPEDLDISITRDMVTIKGKREGERTVNDGDYYHRELYWGTFSRSIVLPQEIDIEESEAVEKHGLLIIKMPKMDKDKQARLRVKAN